MHTLSGHAASIRFVCFSPDSSLIASGSSDKSLRLWRTGSGQLLRTNETNASLQAVSFTPDGKRILAGSMDRQVHIWTVQSTAVAD